MWPHKKGLGIRCSYGVDGNGMLSLDSSPPILEFPRKKDSGVLLNQINNSYQVLLPSQTSRFILNSKIFNDLQSNLKSFASKSMGVIKKSTTKRSGSYVPSDILDSYMIESKALTSAIAYDPTFGSLLVIFPLKSLQVIAYVTGESGTILNISNLMRDHTEGTSGSKQFTLEKPLLGKSLQIELPSPIKQIVSVKGSALQQHLIVRTNAKSYVLTCSKSRNLMASHFDIYINGEISTSQLKGFDFADIASNQWDPNQFCLMDIRGNFGLWKIGRTDRKVSKISTEMNSDSSELSNWKRVIWCDSSHLLAFSRSSIIQFIINGTSSVLATANTWSRIQDVQSEGDSCFLLTSKELIWCGLKPFKRLISWKHFLDDSDPTLKIHCSETTKDSYIVLIFSQMHPLIMVYNFGMEDGKPCSLRDPYYHRKQSEGDLQQLHLFPWSDEPQAYGLFEVTTSLSLSFSSLSLLKLSMEMVNGDVGESPAPEEPKQKLFKRISYRKLLPLIRDFSSENEASMETQMHEIQNYAYKLGGEGPYKINLANSPSYFSLIDISLEIPMQLTDVAEVDLMVEELSGFYTLKGIGLSSLINSAFYKKYRYITENTISSNKTIEDLHGIFKLVFFSHSSLNEQNKFTSLRLASLLIGASLIKAKSTQLSSSLESKYAEELQKSSAEVQRLLGNWDDEESIVEEETDFSSPKKATRKRRILLSQRVNVQLRESLRDFSQVESQDQNSQIDTHDRLNPIASQERLPPVNAQYRGLSSQFKDSQVLSQLSQTRIGSQKKFKLSSQNSSQRKKKKKGGFA